MTDPREAFMRNRRNGERSLFIASEHRHQAQPQRLVFDLSAMRVYGNCRCGAVVFSPISFGDLLLYFITDGLVRNPASWYATPEQ